MANYWQKALNAVFYANPVKLQKLIDEGHFYNRLLEDTGLLSKPFPIWRITQCWEDAIGDRVDEFIESTRAELAAFVARNKQVKEIFRTQLGVEFTPIDYHAYTDNFFSAYPDETDEDILDGETPETLAKYGTTQLDLDLYCAVERFDIPLVISLLQKGANPHARIMRDESENAFSRIGCESSYLCTCRLSYAWQAAYEHNSIEEDEARDLIGWAAHETMYATLEKYNTCPEPEEPELIYPEEVLQGSAKFWCIHDGEDDSTGVILDGSRAWFIVTPEDEYDLRKYSLCVSGLEKDFMKEFGAQNHDGLIDAMMAELDCPQSIGKMLARVQGKKEFTVWDFRNIENATLLEKALTEISWKDQGTSREYQMKWYFDVTEWLRKFGVSDDEIAAMFQKKPIPVLWLRNHGGKTPETMAKMYLENKENDKEEHQYQ